MEHRYIHNRKKLEGKRKIWKTIRDKAELFCFFFFSASLTKKRRWHIWVKSGWRGGRGAGGRQRRLYGLLKCSNNGQTDGQTDVGSGYRSREDEFRRCPKNPPPPERFGLGSHYVHTQVTLHARGRRTQARKEILHFDFIVIRDIIMNLILKADFSKKQAFQSDEIQRVWGQQEVTLKEKEVTFWGSWRMCLFWELTFSAQ